MNGRMVFEWPGRHHLHVALPLMILLAAVLHAGVFFLFSITYPKAETTGTNPAHVFFVTSANADWERLESLVRSADSAVFAPGRGLDLPDPVPGARYTPSFDSGRPELAPLPPGARLDAPSEKFAGPLPVRFSPPPPAEGSPEPVVTRLVGTDAVASRAPALPEGTVFPVPKGFDPEPCLFFVAVRGDGIPSRVFLQKSSGNPSLDAKAEALLRSLKFQPSPLPEDWGFIAFEWGSDVHPITQQ